MKRNSSNRNNTKRSHSKIINCAFVQFKTENLVAGFRGCGIVPVNKEALKRLPRQSKGTENEDSIKILNESCYRSLKSIVVLVSLQNPNERKEVRKVQPGKAVTLEDFRDEENDQALESTPCSSTRKSSKIHIKKK